VDIGGTGIKMGAVEIEHAPQVLATDLLLDFSDQAPEAVLAEVGDRLRSLVRAAGWKEAEGVGVGSAGLIRRDKGEIAFSPNLPNWTGIPVLEILASHLGLPVRVDNDVNAFALAEWWWGAGERASDAVFLTLGTGIGGAVIADGRLIRGWSGFAGEPGHATLVLGGTECPCGNHGCAERYVGSRGIVDAARRHPGYVQDPVRTDSEPLTPRALSQAASQGSRVAGEVLTEAGRALGGLLVSLINTLNPERVVIGGGVAQAGSLLLDPAREHVAGHSLVARYAAPKILPAGLGEPAGLLGSAALFLDDMGDP
jgi:glucokinase